MAPRLLLIDASSSIFRAFYAIRELRTADGIPTNATLGFVNMLMKLLRDTRPEYVVVVWDSPGPTRRKRLYPEYKANRDATPEDLRAQIPYIRRAVAGYGLAHMEYDGEEADDVIATLTRQAESKGLEVRIVSTDKDLMQLVSPQVKLLDTGREREIGPDEVEERFGVPPDQLLDVRALIGDSSDNIPGVKGIGEKGAAALVREFGSLDALLDHPERVKSKRAREALLDQAETARLSRELSRLRDDLPLELDLERARIPEPDVAVLTELYSQLEFRRLLDDLGGEIPAAKGEIRHVETTLITDPAGLAALVEQLIPAERLAIAAVLEPPEPMTGALCGIALSDRIDQAFFVAFDRLSETEALEQLVPLLEGEGHVWVGLHLKPDLLALARRGIELSGPLHDTSLAAYLLDPSQQVQRLDALSRSYLGRELASAEEVFGKGAKRRHFDEVEVGELGAFIGTQVSASLELVEELEVRLEAAGQTGLFVDLEVPLVRVLARMEGTGVRIDEGLLAGLSTEIEADLTRLESEIYELAGEEFKINSPKQLQKILFEKHGLPSKKRTKTGFSTDESVLEELSQSYELPERILGWRKLAKLKSTYVDALPRLVHPETGRIHCQFNQTVAATGRLSASNPNLQNIPIRTPLGLRIREAFIPAEGRALLSADYSQIELRILAHLCEDEVLIEAFREGVDIHVQTASRVFEIPPEQVDSGQRASMKAINFGILYGSSAFGIARTLGVTQAEAARHIEAYFGRYPRVRSYLDTTIARARELGYAETLDGRRRYLPDLDSRNRAVRQAAERMATNAVIQGTAADLIKRAMVQIDADLQTSGAPDAQMILQVHDELVFEVVPQDVGRLRELVAERMQGVAHLRVPLEVHTGEGPNWREAH
jgi:DNA polymerase-1